MAFLEAVSARSPEGDAVCVFPAAPVFTRNMKLVVFRPYWNVPPSIIKKELTPHLQKSGAGYLAAKNFEVTKGDGTVVTDYTAADIEHLRYAVREKPGPKNSLGAIKFAMPNPMDIYLHSTPARELCTGARMADAGGGNSGEARGLLTSATQRKPCVDYCSYVCCLPAL